MGPIIKLLFLALFALTTGAAPAAHDLGVGTYGKFSDYCSFPTYIDTVGTSVATFDADCSSKKGGTNNLGAQLANSQLDFNDCFVNDDGKLIPHKGLANPRSQTYGLSKSSVQMLTADRLCSSGKAMESCSCDIGYSVCGSNCPSTKMRCQCKNKAGEMVVGDMFDIGQLTVSPPPNYVIRFVGIHG